MFPRPPLGRPSRFPLALAAASPSLVRSEIRSRSTSANNPNRAIITLVGRSCLPSNSIASLMAMKRILRTSGDAEVGDGFQGGVQEKVKWGLFRSVKDYSIQNIV